MSDPAPPASPVTWITNRFWVWAAAMLVLTGVSGALLVYGARHAPPAAAPLPGRTFSYAAPRFGEGAVPNRGSVSGGPGPGGVLVPAGASLHGRGATPTGGRGSGPGPGGVLAPSPGADAPGPGRVLVPSLGIDAAWINESVTAGALSIPADVHVVGLSAEGAQPGSATGTVLLASHVNYAGQGPGAFAALYRVGPGAVVIVTDRDGNASRWQVIALADPMKEELDPGLFTAAGPPRLVLITCGGQVHDGQYDRNVVATAIPAAAS